MQGGSLENSYIPGEKTPQKATTFIFLSTDISRKAFMALSMILELQKARIAVQHSALPSAAFYVLVSISM